MKTEKIYIEPFYVEFNATNTGFKMHVFGNTDKGKGKKHEIIINFEIWWIPYLLKKMKKILISKIEYLKNIDDKIID